MKAIVTGFVMFLLPWYAVHAYRAVPCRVRGCRVWPGSSGPSSSHMALDAMAQGVNGWAAVWTAILSSFDNVLDD